MDKCSRPHAASLKRLRHHRTRPCLNQKCDATPTDEDWLCQHHPNFKFLLAIRLGALSFEFPRPIGIALTRGDGVNWNLSLATVDLATKPSDLGLRITGHGPPHPTIGQFRGAPTITTLFELVTEVVGRLDCTNKIIILQRR